MYLAMLTLPLLGSISFDAKVLIFISKISCFFILAFSGKIGYVYTYIYQEFINITCNQPFIVISMILQSFLILYLLFLFFKRIGFKKLAIFISYIFCLFQFIDSCITNSMTNYFSISIITLCSVLSVIPVYNNFFMKQSKTPKESVFTEALTKFYFLPKKYIILFTPVIIMSLFFTVLFRHVSIYFLDLSHISLTSHLFIVFSLIVPGIIFFRIVYAIILHYRLTHGNVCILSVIFQELFNISNYRLNNIDLTLTVSILTFGVFSTTIIELIYLNIDSINSPVQVNEGVGLYSKYNYWNIIRSCNDSSLTAVEPSDSPTFTDTPPPTSSPFLPDSPARSVSPPPSFEQKLWLNRRESLQDAKALDLGKRILLYKICSARNIPRDIQMYIQDCIWGNHWYELYTTEYAHDESGNIVHNSTLDHLPGDVTYSFQEGDYSFVDGRYLFTPNSNNT